MYLTKSCLTASTAWVLWLGFTEVKTKGKKKKKKQRLEKELWCPNHPCNWAGSPSQWHAAGCYAELAQVV